MISIDQLRRALADRPAEKEAGNRGPAAAAVALVLRDKPMMMSMSMRMMA